MDRSALSTTKNLMRSSLDDTTGDWKAGGSFKIEVNLAS
jgi:hypothetical protein